MTEVSVDDLLQGLDGEVKAELKSNPEVEDKHTDPGPITKLPIQARKWFRLDSVVAVVADLRGSTSLGVGKHAASTAAIYQAATGGLCAIYDEFDADFVAIQGDGAIALFWGDRRMERAICAGITVKTFTHRFLQPQLEKKWPDAPKTGFKVGMAVSSLLVKRVGVPRSAFQEPVWAGKAVNYAAKCAQQAEPPDMIVTGSIWDFVETNDYLAASCTCGTGPTSNIWQDVEIHAIHVDDGERAGRRLTSEWCVKHGDDFCSAILAGETSRPRAAEVVKTARAQQLKDAFRKVQRDRRRDQENIRRGLAMR